MINLDEKALRSIVKDGIKEMMSHVAGRSRDARKRVWVVAVKAAIKEYQEKLEEEFLPTLVKVFIGSTVVRFKGAQCILFFMSWLICCPKGIEYLS